MIISIQSHVAYGYVGNRAATFPLQRMGYEVITINTVQFSNHTGYGDFTGDIFSPGHIENLIAGLENRGVLADVTAILSGYLGDARIGEIILNLAQKCPSALYACDPVMGDVGRGFFVKDGIPDFFKNNAIKAAHIITPNQFELSHLSGLDIQTLGDAKAACAAMHAEGVEIVLLTSLDVAETKPGEISMLLSHQSGGTFQITTPRLDFEVPPSGSGDTTAALFLGHYLKDRNLQNALEATAAGIFNVFEETKKMGRRELALIQAQDSYTGPVCEFKALKLTD